jgi:hypothetical protein
MDRSGADLTQSTCWELLATATVGRLALSIHAMPTIVPVRYLVDDAAVAISLGRPGLPMATVHDAVVAFAVDDIDEGTATGWMVQMLGVARLAPSSSPAADGPFPFLAPARALAPLPAPDDPGPAGVDQVVRLVPGLVTGHRFTLEPFARPD